MSAGDDARRRLAAMCDVLPECAREDANGHVGFSVRGRRFAWLMEDHHGDGLLALSCRAAPGVNSALVTEDATAFFLPTYVAARGWLGLYLDTPSVDWDRAEELLRDAYRMTAPKALVRQLDTP